jgi:hypothetical protein
VYKQENEFTGSTNKVQGRAPKGIEILAQEK